MDKLADLKKKIEDIQAKSAVAGEMKAFIELVLGVIKKSKEEFSTISAENISIIKNTLNYLDSEHDKLLKTVSKERDGAVKDFENKLEEANKLIAEIKAIEVHDGAPGLPGKDADEEVIVEKVLAKIPPVEIKDIEAGEIADKLETLKGDKRLDASAIKNLPEFVESKANGGGWRNLFQLHDVVLTDVADGEVLTYDSDTQTWVNEAGGAGGVDTANSPNAGEFARFTDADTIEGRTVAEVYSDLGITASAAELNLLDGITVLSGSNTGDQTSIVGITGTKAQFDTAVTDGNFLYVGDVTSNATHTGEVTGATALTVDKTAITNKTEVTAVGTDYVLISDTSDGGNLKKALASDLTGSGSVAWGSITGTLTDQTDLVTELNRREILSIAYACAL